MCPVETFRRLFEVKLPGSIDIECRIESANGKRIITIDECMRFFFVVEGFTSSHRSCFFLVMISGIFNILLYLT
jgi:hypothetical protein